MRTPHSIEGRGLRGCVTGLSKGYPSAIRCDIAISWPVQHSRLFPIGIPSGNRHTCAGGRHGYMAATNQRLLAGPSPPPAPAGPARPPSLAARASPLCPTSASGGAFHSMMMFHSIRRSPASTIDRTCPMKSTLCTASSTSTAHRQRQLLSASPGKLIWSALGSAEAVDACVSRRSCIGNTASIAGLRISDAT